MNEQKIDKYLMDLLSVEERALFEEEMRQNESLMKEVELQRDALKSIEGLGRANLKSKLQDIHTELYPASQASDVKLRKLLYRFAAAAVFIALVSITWWQMQDNASPSELYSQYFSTYELSLSERSGIDDDLIRIEQLYEQQKYAELIPLLQQKVAENAQNSELLLGLGIAHLQKNDFDSAIKQFQSILDSNDFNYEDEANWYLGLSHLKSGNIESAKQFFTILASDASRDHSKEAKRILDRI